MRCPACENSLSATTAGGVTVDACVGGCGGIWFDNFELKKFDEPHETSAEQLYHIPVDLGVKVDPTQKRQCPRCEGMPMRRHFFSMQRKVEVDSCPNCGGYWLDAGELESIRTEFRSLAEKKQATDIALKRQSSIAQMRVRSSAEASEQRVGTLINVVWIMSDGMP